MRAFHSEEDDDCSRSAERDSEHFRTVERSQWQLRAILPAYCKYSWNRNVCRNLADSHIFLQPHRNHIVLVVTAISYLKTVHLESFTSKLVKEPSDEGKLDMEYSTRGVKKHKI